MTFNEEEFDMMLNDYGIVVSDRTRRLIHRNNMKREQARNNKIIYNTNVFNIIKQNLLWCVNIVKIVCTPIIWILAVFIWFVLYIIKKSLEIMMILIIIKIVSEYIKTNGKLQFPVY
jgi:hypothetical protein